MTELHRNCTNSTPAAGAPISTRMKALIAAGVFAGSTVGSYVPALWGGSLMSAGSILLGVVGGAVGIWAGYRVGQNLDL